MARLTAVQAWLDARVAHANHIGETYAKAAELHALLVAQLLVVAHGEFTMGSLVAAALRVEGYSHPDAAASWAHVTGSHAFNWIMKVGALKLPFTSSATRGVLGGV